MYGGAQEVTVTISVTNLTPLGLTGAETVFPETAMGVTFDDASFVFDGTAKSLAVTGKLPTVTSVAYKDNSRTDVGMQEVTATITGTNFNTLVLTADLIVTPAHYTEVTVDDARFVFAFTAKSLAVKIGGSLV